LKKKPKVVLLSYLDHIRDLDDYVDLHYHNCKMPDEHFFEVAKDADIIVEQEFNDGKAKYAGLLNMVDKPKKAVWLIDTHTRPDHAQYAQNFDKVFVAIDSLMGKIPMRTHHLPLACTFSKKDVCVVENKKTLDVAFVGQFLIKGGRKKVLESLSLDLTRKKIPHQFTTAYKQAYIDIHRAARVGFNKSIGNELNFRVFEVMAMGVPQVTDLNAELCLVPGLKDKVYTYKAYSEIIPQIESLLSRSQKSLDDEMREKQEWLKNGHMITHRHIEIIERTLGYSLKK